MRQPSSPSGGIHGRELSRSGIRRERCAVPAEECRADWGIALREVWMPRGERVVSPPQTRTALPLCASGRLRGPPASCRLFITADPAALGSTCAPLKSVHIYAPPCWGFTVSSIQRTPEVFTLFLFVPVIISTVFMPFATPASNSCDF